MPGSVGTESFIVRGKRLDEVDPSYSAVQE